MEQKKKDDATDEVSGALSRRSFLAFAAGTGAGIILSGCDSSLFNFLKPKKDSTLEGYPARDWEKVYRNIYKEDSHFHFLCSPNDTHNCLLKAHVKNGVITRISPSYRYGEARDLYGNTASHRWDPRVCQKGLGLVRRVYGDRRVKGAMVRKGFKDWVDKGMPRDSQTGKPPKEYFENRGQDKWLKLPWDAAFALTAKALYDISKTYSGDKGTELLTKQGYDQAMIEATKMPAHRPLRSGVACLSSVQQGFSDTTGSAICWPSLTTKYGGQGRKSPWEEGVGTAIHGILICRRAIQWYWECRLMNSTLTALSMPR